MAEAHEEGTVAAGTFQLPVQVHTALAPHAAVARWRGRSLEVWASTKIGCTLPGSIHLCEVEVDTLLGRVQATRAWVGVTSGKVLCPPVATSQMEGAVVQGLSYALYEQRLLDPRSGRLLTHNLDDYRIAGISDVPPIEVHFDEEGYEHVRGGAIGIGEIGTVGVTASVANAVFHATGWRPHRLPLHPQRLLEALA